MAWLPRLGTAPEHSDKLNWNFAREDCWHTGGLPAQDFCKAEARRPTAHDAENAMGVWDSKFSGRTRGGMIHATGESMCLSKWRATLQQGTTHGTELAHTFFQNAVLRFLLASNNW